MEKTQKISDNEIIKYYDKQGFWLVRINKNTKKPKGEWQNQPRPKPDEVKNWLLDGDGIAIAHGAFSNTAAIDIDDPKLYDRLYGDRDWERETLVIVSSIITKKGIGKLKKRHLIFKTKFPINTKHYAHKGIKIDLIGHGNYSVAPPSLHPDTGEKYKFEQIPLVNVKEWEGNLAEDFEQLLVDKLGYKRTKEAIQANNLFLPRKEGERHFWEIRLVTWLILCGVDKETAWEQIIKWNETNNPSLSLEELEYQFNDMWERGGLTNIKFDRKPTEYFSQETMEKAEKVLWEKPLDAILGAVHELHMGDDLLILADYLSALSAKLSTPTVNTWGIGRSQIGKSHLKYSVLEATLPKDYYEIFTSASPLSLFYYVKEYGENAFDGAIIYIDEVESSEQTLPTLRSLTGQTDITPRHLSVYDAEILDLKIKGKRTVWFTSIKAFGSEQLRNRFLFLNPDETVEQNINIADLQSRKYFLNVNVDRSKSEIAKAVTTLIVQNTKEMDVDFSYGFTWPFAHLRYLLPLFISMLKVCTKIHYKQRQVNDKGNLISISEDFEIVKQIWKAMEKEILFRVNRSCQAILDTLSTRENALTTAEIARNIGRTTKWVHRHLQELSNSDLINADKRAQGRIWEYWISDLPKVEAITLLKETQIKVLSEFPKNSGKRGSVNTNTKSSEKMGNSLKGSKKASFDFDELYKNTEENRNEQT